MGEAISIGRGTRLGEIMVRDVVALQVTERTSEVAKLMKAHPIHHLPVLEGRVLRGMISQRDLYRAANSSYYFDSEVEQQEFLDTCTDLQGMMTADPIALAPEDTVGQALDLMIEYGIGCVPVVNERCELLGLVTETDMLRLFQRSLVQAEAPAGPQRAGGAGRRAVRSPRA